MEVVLLGTFLLCFAPLIHAMCAPVDTTVASHDMHHALTAPADPMTPSDPANPAAQVTPTTSVLSAGPADSVYSGSPTVPLDAGAAVTLLIVGLALVALVLAVRPSRSPATAHSRSAGVRLGGIPPPRTRPPLLTPSALGVLRT